MSKIKFYKIASSEPAVQLITKQLLDLGNRNILLMLSGGSAMPIEVAVLNNLRSIWQTMTVSLIDERFGEVGHPDSNMTQLQSAGLPSDISCQPVLRDKSPEATTANYDQFLRDAVSEYDEIIGILGLGADGHTSGILPGSPALNSEAFVCSYQGPDYLRITTTPAFLSRLSAVYLYAVGETKWPQLQRLGQEIPAADQPAQVLKEAQNLIIFNDLIGEDLV